MSGNRDLRDILSPTAALLLPGGQAVLIGFASGTMIGSLALMFSWGDPVLYGSLSGAIGFSAGLLHGLTWWRERVTGILREAETTTMQVYPAEIPQVKISIDWDEGRSGLFDDLMITDDLFIEWCCGVAAGKSIGENHWTGSANPFSKGQYHNFIDRLESPLGIIRRAGKGKSSGYTLTGKGRAVTGEILRRYGTPSPALQSYHPGA